MSILKQITWPSFWRRFLALGLGGIAVLYLAILLVDPYDVVVFSPKIDRGVTASNQRFAWPAMARSKAYDSAIIGTSTTRLLKPAQLNRTIGGSFVNLSFNSGTAWEQSQILKLFARHHTEAKAVIFGIDGIWCNAGAPAPRLTGRPFPEWMYDDNPWNDLANLLNLKTIEEAGKQIGHLTGLRPSPRKLGGYHDFLPARSEYVLKRAQGHIYGAGGPRAPKAQVPPYDATSAERQAWRFPSHQYMAGMFADLPPKTLKIMLFVPIHRQAQPPPGSKAAVQLDECKRRLEAIAGKHPNAHVIDFMFDSRITRTDTNYWDALHYSHEIAAELGRLIPEAIRTGSGATDVFRYRGPTP